MVFNPVNLTLLSASDDSTIKIWKPGEIDRINLLHYVESGLCQFDDATEEIRWIPYRNLGIAATQFSYLRPQSSLGILHNYDSSKEEESEIQNWLLYLENLKAENWKSAELSYQKLTDAQRAQNHGILTWALSTLAEQAPEALQNAFPVLASARTKSAVLFSSRIENSRQKIFYEALGKNLVENEITREDAFPILDKITEQTSRSLVMDAAVETEVMNIVSELSDSSLPAKDVLKEMDQASWVDRTGVFERMEAAQLKGLVAQFYKESDGELVPVFLQSSKELLQKTEDWESNLFHGMALARSGNYKESIGFLERALQTAAQDLEKTDVDRIKAALNECKLWGGEESQIISEAKPQRLGEILLSAFTVNSDEPNAARVAAAAIEKLNSIPVQAIARPRFRSQRRTDSSTQRALRPGIRYRKFQFCNPLCDACFEFDC